MKTYVTFGEIMLRLSPPGMLRFSQARTFDVIYGGGEANVAVSLANFGLQTKFVTRLPQNNLGQAAIQYLQQYNVGTEYILRGGDRLGIYFLENGAAMRSSQVIYDRTNSSFACIAPGMVNWKPVFMNAQWFHWTGITPAISEGSAASCLEGIRVAKEMGITISCDMNYRAKLWKWGRTAGEVMRELVSLCDIAICNEEDADKVFGIKSRETNVLTGSVAAKQYYEVCDSLRNMFPNLKQIAITLRGSLSASHNTWSGIFWNQGDIYIGPVFDIAPIIDRIGGGDSFAAGLIYGLSQFDGDNQSIINFAVAASALKHTIIGDFNLISIEDVEKLIMGNLSGRVIR